MAVSASLLGAQARALTSTDVLPKNVRAAAFVYAFADGIHSSLNSSGHLESLVSPLNRTITFDDLAGYAPELRDLQVALNSLGPDRLGDNLVAANLYADIHVREQQYVSALLWGLSDAHSLGLRVPYIKRSYRAGFRAEITNNAAAINRVLGDLPEFPKYVKQLEDQMSDPGLFSQRIFTDRGYKVPANFEAKGLGDLELEYRYRFLNRERVQSALRANVRFPTATYKPDMNNVIDRPLTDNVYAVKAGPALDLRLWPHVLTFRGGLFRTWRAASTQLVALPRDPEAPLADLTERDAAGNQTQVEEVYKKLGSQCDVDLVLMLDFWQGAVSFSASYVESRKNADVYRGTRGLDYARLMENTDVVSRGLEMSTEISSLPLFASSKAPLPGKVVMSWYQPIGGKNIIFAPYGRFDVILLF